MSFKREIKFTPAWDRRSDDPKKDYGIHGVDMTFLLLGEKGAYQFVVYTGWHLPNSLRDGREFQNVRGYKSTVAKISDLLPADVGYHAKTPQYEDQSPMSVECEYTGGVCYYDGSSLQAYDVFGILVEQGSEGVWKHLEQLYNERFGETL